MEKKSVNQKQAAAVLGLMLAELLAFALFSVVVHFLFTTSWSKAIAFVGCYFFITNMIRKMPKPKGDA